MLSIKEKPAPDVAAAVNMLREVGDWAEVIAILAPRFETLEFGGEALAILQELSNNELLHKVEFAFDRPLHRIGIDDLLKRGLIDLMPSLTATELQTADEVAPKWWQYGSAEAKLAARMAEVGLRKASRRT